MRPVRTAAVALTCAGAGVFGYAAGYEVRSFRLRRLEVRCLPAGRRDLRVLHVSDIHLMPHQSRKLAWLQSLAELEPDLVVNTGDNISHPDAIQPLLEGLAPFLELPGVFVLGSNDYWGPVLKSPLRYFAPAGGKRLHGPPLPWRDLHRRFVDAGWTDLGNRRDSLTVAGTTVAFAGVDDPHLRYDRLPDVAGPADVAADLRLGVTHAPYLRVLDQFTRDGYDMILAGHTHGGQLRVPGYGALVTNCDIDRARARGLHRHRYGPASAWLHVSAGCGTSPYAPYRFCCPPEATMLTLTPRDEAGDREARNQPAGSLSAAASI